MLFLRECDALQGLPAGQSRRSPSYFRYSIEDKFLMTHDEKVAHFITEMAKRGQSGRFVAPPFYRLLWKCGIKLPPPLFQSFLSNFLIFGMFFAVSWGIIMSVAVWRAHDTPVYLFSLLIAGVIFGAIMAPFCSWKAAKLKLPRWENYPDGEQAGRNDADLEKQ